MWVGFTEDPAHTDIAVQSTSMQHVPNRKFQKEKKKVRTPGLSSQGSDDIAITWACEGTA